jgi:hypothetical protein
VDNAQRSGNQLCLHGEYEGFGHIRKCGPGIRAMISSHGWQSKSKFMIIKNYDGKSFLLRPCGLDRQAGIMASKPDLLDFYKNQISIMKREANTLESLVNSARWLLDESELNSTGTVTFESRLTTIADALKWILMSPSNKRFAMESCSVA